MFVCVHRHRTELDCFSWKNNNFLQAPPTPPVHLLTCLLLYFAIDFRLRLFSWWRAFDCSRFLLAAGCRRAVWLFRFSVLAVCGRTMHEWRVVPCSNLDEVLPGSPEPGGKFFLSFFLSKSLLYIVVMRNNGFSVLPC